ncbi:MAG: ATP-dependent sacrificial sulfur transferase LarE [Nitrospira sp.]|nr:ATP-dependent sacrificial sulfur transferase LarE [Nitrospira sp.]
MSEFESKLTNLLEILKNLKSAVLAYSGGVDSTFLLKALKLSGIRALAVTAVSEITPHNDLQTAKRMAKEFEIEHRIIETDELSSEEFVRNTPERCFYCKDALFKNLTDVALSEGYAFILDGSQLDDTSDYRPGKEAAKKYNVRGPLIEAEFSKKEVRELSRQLGIPFWDRPSSSCLATRFPYGQRITREALKRVESAEEFLRDFGFHKVRVRDQGGIARIEVGEDEIDLVLNVAMRKMIYMTLKALGYTFVSLDLEGYRSGSMNRTIDL